MGDCFIQTLRAFGQREQSFKSSVPIQMLKKIGFSVVKLAYPSVNVVKASFGNGM